jgi:16S rRNA pseudouridine516 synthase
VGKEFRGHIKKPLPKRLEKNEMKIRKKENSNNDNINLFDKLERLDKVLSNMGYGTRSDVKKLLKGGAIDVDGIRETDGSTKVAPERNVIHVEGERLIYKKFIYLMLNKPKGYLSATWDAQYKTVSDLIPLAYKHFEPFPVGRLDADTVGLLLLTNDGDLAHRMLSPKKHVKKIYIAKLDKPVNGSIISAFLEGVALGDGYICKPAKLQILCAVTGTEIMVTITEGKFHQIKRMFRVFDINVLELKRVEMAGIKLDPNLREGDARELNKDELELITIIKNSC